MKSRPRTKSVPLTKTYPLTAQITAYQGARSGITAPLKAEKGTVLSKEGLSYIKNKADEMKQRMAVLQKEHKDKMEELLGSLDEGDNAQFVYIKNKTDKIKLRLEEIQNKHKEQMENILQQTLGDEQFEDEEEKKQKEAEHDRLLTKAINIRKFLESLDEIGDESTFLFYQSITDELNERMESLQNEHKQKMEELLEALDDSEDEEEDTPNDNVYIKNKTDALKLRLVELQNEHKNDMQQILDSFYDDKGWQTVKSKVIDVKRRDSVMIEQDEEQKDREKKNWIVGSKCSIFSKSEKKWVIGQIIKIFTDDEGEWLVVKYSGNKMKEIQRYSDGIKPTPLDIAKIAEKHSPYDNIQDFEIDDILDEIDEGIDDYHHDMVNSASVLTKNQETGLFRAYQENKSKYYSLLVNQYKLNGAAIEEITAKFKYLIIMKYNTQYK